MKNKEFKSKSIFLILSFALLSVMTNCSKEGDKIEVFLAGNATLSDSETELQSVRLDSKLLDTKDIISYDKSTFTFTLTSESSSRLEKMDLDGKAFCVVKNGQKLLVGWFWKCTSSLGMTGFVTFDFTCSNREKLELKYCLGPKEYPNENDPRKEIIIANNTYN